MELLKFVVKRLMNGFLVMIGVVIVIFALFNILPVNSARMTLGQRADTASVEAIEKEFRLNLPWYHRLVLYFNDISPLSLNDVDNTDAPSYLNADEVKFAKLFTIGSTSLVLKAPYLGKSFQTRRQVAEVLGEKIYPTFVLAITAMTLASFIGIILGVFAAIRQYSFWDNAILVMSTFGISQPAYFSGIILAMVFGYYLSDWTHLNVRGSLTDMDYNGETITIWKNLWLPMVALGVRPVAIITQLTRSSMLDVLSQDYVRTAKAKGLSYYSVVFKHALRNAMNPVVTSISGWLAALLTGAFFIEKVFDYKGLGLQTIESLLSFDFPVVMGSVLFVAFIFVVMNIFTDILYSVLDPSNGEINPQPPKGGLKRMQLNKNKTICLLSFTPPLGGRGCVFLIGFMGSGKTTFGKKLASKLKMKFVDLDEAICIRTEFASIKDLIGEKGFDFFRQEENETLKSLLPEGKVISTGGGTPCYFDNLEWMKSKGTVVFLNVDEGVIYSRLMNTDFEERPLLKNMNEEELKTFIHDKLEERMPFYKLANIVFDPVNEKMEDLIAGL